MKAMTPVLEKLEQVCLEFEFHKPVDEAHKEEAEEKLAAMKDAKKSLAKLVFETEKYISKGVFLTWI